MRLDSPRQLLVFATVLSLATPSETQKSFVPIPRAELCVTEGEITALNGNRLSIDVPKVRAFVDEPTEQRIQANFSYLGPTEKQSELGSGERRVQFGLKLHANNPCNLVYVMWRIEPKSDLVVSVKSNPGQHTSSECTNHGYRNIKADRSRSVPALHAGDSHRIRAEIDGLNLKVLVDGAEVWEGSLPPVVLGFQGSVGIRSDNARVQFELRAPKAPPIPRPQVTCRPGPEESD